MPEQPLKIIVIGGVAAGTSAASRARRTDPSAEITLYEKGEYISYGACDEPYYIGGEIPSWENLLVRPPKVFEEKQNIRIRLHHEVEAIDPLNKTVLIKNLETGDEFEKPWDRLIIATGAAPRPLDIEGADLPGVFQMKFLTQARAVKEYIENHQPGKAVIIGAGFIGLEMAEALRANGIEVTLLEMAATPGGPVEPEIAGLIAKTLEENGVEFLPEAKVEKIVAGESGRVSMVFSDKGKHAADMVIAGIGVAPQVDIAEKAGIRLGPTGAIETDARQRTNIDGIFAAGDCCQTIHMVSGDPIYTPLGDIANKQGWAAGENATGGDAKYHGSLGSAHFRVFDLEVGTTGLNSAQASDKFDIVTKTITHRSRAHAQPKGVGITVKLIADKTTGRLLGAQTAGKEGAAHRINTLAVCVFNKMTIEQMTRMDFAYAPPFSAVIDPILTASRVLYKTLTN